jgi:hypothetical protein
VGLHRCLGDRPLSPGLTGSLSASGAATERLGPEREGMGALSLEEAAKSNERAEPALPATELARECVCSSNLRDSM